jgi:hypothetical protein
MAPLAPAGIDLRSVMPTVRRMRRLTFAHMPGVGPGLFARRGSLADLVLALPYVVMYEIPPRRVLNDVLVRGRLDAGMSGGCIWKPKKLGDADFADLVRELQRRGTRPVKGGDPGGKPFRLPELPDSVQTYAGWAAFRYRQQQNMNPELLAALERRASEPAPEGCKQWLEELPVEDLYLAYLDAKSRDWRELADDAFEVPAELVAKLRRLERANHDWSHTRGGMTDDELREWERQLAADHGQARGEIRECVDRLELPYWPFDRFSISDRMPER